MRLTVCQTVHNRTPEVIKAVCDSFRLPGNKPDDMVIALDRATKPVKDACRKTYHNMGFRVIFTFLGGEPGWKGPARAWNRAFKTATSAEALYCISSEVVQDEGNIDKVRKHLAERPNTAIFGACHNSEPTGLVVGAEPDLLVSTKMPRPLGFIVAMPAQAVRDIGGFDETFMQGFWYDDDDFFLRLWNHGLDFLFDDSIHGIHLDHDRPVLDTPEGQAGIQHNRDTFHKKHAHQLHHGLPWFQTLRRIETRTGSTLLWEHE